MKERSPVIRLLCQSKGFTTLQSLNYCKRIYLENRGQESHTITGVKMENMQNRKENNGEKWKKKPTRSVVF